MNADTNNCGSCTNVCPSNNAVASCNSGTCGLAFCNAGFFDCDNNSLNGCEVNSASDPKNCGGCGKTCSTNNAAEICVAGACTIQSCTAGFWDCNNSALDGCEVNGNSDTKNCGGFGKTCSTLNGSPSCTAGTCGIAFCNAGFFDCNNNPLDGCEVNSITDTFNCGACHHVCPSINSSPICSSGTCAIASCNTGFVDCNGFAGDGCEANIVSDPNNCGHCFGQCSRNNGVPICNNGQCKMQSCNNGFADCNNVASDGCETNTLSDKNNCGTCGFSVSYPIILIFEVKSLLI